MKNVQSEEGIYKLKYCTVKNDNSVKYDKENNSIEAF